MQAIQQNHFPTWPGFTVESVQRYLPDTSPVIDQGHMERQRQGIRLTTREGAKQEKTDTTETFDDFHPPIEKEEMNQMFCGLAIIDKKHGTVYTDFTGNFPIRSARQRAIMICTTKPTLDNQAI